MAYSVPTVHAVGDILTAAQWNVVANDIIFLAGTAFATVATSQSTTSTGYTDLATAGPAVTLTTGANALVTVTAAISNATGADNAYMGFAVSAGTTVAAADASSLQSLGMASLVGVQASATFGITGLNAGSNTFTAKYRCNAGTGEFANRTIIVQPQP